MEKQKIYVIFFKINYQENFLCRKPGECAAPKLLQYAYKHQLKPIAMAEFWWGDSPKAEIRHHGYYYPACKVKMRTYPRDICYRTGSGRKSLVKKTLS